MFDSPSKLLFLIFVCLIFVYFFGSIFGIDVYGAIAKSAQKWMR